MMAAISHTVFGRMTATAGLVCLLGAAGIAQGQGFETRIIADGLESPTGIDVTNNGTVYFTEVPTPGIPGSMGGRNKVSKLDARSSMIELLSAGEPEPLNIVLGADGTLYWTCRTAGVILARDSNGMTTHLMEGLELPSGIDVRNRYVVFSEIPTPGVPGSMGGTNRIAAYDGITTFPVSVGEPEPNDLTITPEGTAYWTCTTAGVILRRTLDGVIEVVMDGLDQPVGIDSDDQGRIYWTEVPTPGVAGGMGGRNRVVRYDPVSMQLDVVNEGDPFPQDVAVTPNGKFIFWTCQSAGVIVAAREL